MNYFGGRLFSRKRRGRKLQPLVQGGSITYELAHTFVNWTEIDAKRLVVLWSPLVGNGFKEVYRSGIQNIGIGFRRIPEQLVGEGFAYAVWRKEIFSKFGPLYFDSERGARLTWEVMQSQFANYCEKVSLDEAALVRIC